jgi:hypothetical protein
METPIVVAIISGAVSIVASSIAAWATIKAARKKEAHSHPPGPPPLPGQQLPYDHPSTWGSPTDPAPVSAGWRTALWIVAGFFGVAFFASMCQQTTSPPVAMGSWCCDISGVKRCPLPYPLPVGQPCFCPGQGSGIVCQ